MFGSLARNMSGLGGAMETELDVPYVFTYSLGSFEGDKNAYSYRQRSSCEFIQAD